MWVWRGVIAGLLLIAVAFALWRGWKYVDVLPDLAEVFGSLAAAIGFLALVVCLYFLPLIVAVRSKHRNTEAIVVINILLGWTFVFWVLALAWAVHRDVDGRPG